MWACSFFLLFLLQIQTSQTPLQCKGKGEMILTHLLTPGLLNKEGALGHTSVKTRSKFRVLPLLDEVIWRYVLSCQKANTLWDSVWSQWDCLEYALRLPPSDLGRSQTSVTSYKLVSGKQTYQCHLSAAPQKGKTRNKERAKSKTVVRGISVLWRKNRRGRQLLVIVVI